RISEHDVDIIPNEKNNTDENGITLNTEAPKSSIKFLEIITDPEEEVVEEALSDKQKLEKLANDVTVQFSKKIIKNSQSPQTLSNINFIAQEISNFSKDQESRITSKLSELEIDWTKSNDANSKNNLKVDIKKSKTVVTAGENIDISMTVKNNGASPVERVYAVTKSDNPVFNDKEYIFGKIAPGQSKTWTNSFEVPKWALSRDDKVEFELRNYDTDGVEKFQLEVSTRQLLRPRFAFNYELVDDGRSETSGNGNGIPEINEVVGLKFKIKNIGSGTSEKATLLLKNNTGEDLYLKKGRVSLENINPNEVKEETFLFSINKHLKELDLDFQILDDTFRDGIVKNIKFSIPDKSNELVLESVLYITNSDTTPIYGNHLDKNSVIATSIKDSAFESVKSMGSWVKVKLNDGSSGWIDIKHLNKSTVTKENNNKPYINHEYQQSPQIYVEQPPLLINTGKISLSGKVDDADGVELITVF
ncbi:MAG: hypothetical protein GTN99_00905, partial [Candidatus Dadabacteria bacterium]|nr:hypothetical protein [Candidatus Dadabacteria bacterium]NIT12839.1 hypothetical protein [Candidatus Dadabacteria bacterium]